MHPSRRTTNRCESATRSRAVVLGAIRKYFDDCGFVEVQTPVCVETPALEDYVDAIPAGDRWLRTSPELHMKRLVALGMKKIYQIGPCFRADETGTRHRPEFTLLEWYECGADYCDLLDFAKGLIHSVADVLKVDRPATWTTMTVDRAFRKFADVSAVDAIASGRFEELLTDVVEPALGKSPTILIDYPIQLGALARPSAADPTVAERWELYLNGLEIANTYSELVDVDEQRRRFEATAELRKKDGRVAYPIDERFMDALATMPPTAGSAMGIERLMMALLNVDDIGDLSPFGNEL